MKSLGYDSRNRGMNNSVPLPEPTPTKQIVTNEGGRCGGCQSIDIDPSIQIAQFLRNSPMLPSLFWPFLLPNPFYQAEAIAGDFGVNAFFMNEADIGGAFILAGDDIGEFVPYYELTEWAVAYELSGGVEIFRIDYTGESKSFKAEYIYGERTKVYLSVGMQPESLGFGLGGNYAWSNTETGFKVKAFGVSFSWGVCPLPVSIGINKGTIYPYK
jgi:hypothetical protein